MGHFSAESSFAALFLFSAADDFADGQYSKYSTTVAVKVSFVFVV